MISLGKLLNWLLISLGEEYLAEKKISSCSNKEEFFWKKIQGVDLHRSKSHLLQINQKIIILNSNLEPSRTYQKLNYKIQNSKYSE